MTAEEIIKLMDKLNDYLEVYKKEIGDLDAKATVLNDFDHRLVADKKALEADVAKFNEMKKQQGEEKDFIKRTNLEQNAREAYIKEQTKELAAKTIVMETESKQLDEKREHVNELIHKLSGLEEEKKRLSEDRAIVDIEKILDRERKNILDARERKLESEQKRLQNISDSLN